MIEAVDSQIFCENYASSFDLLPTNYYMPEPAKSKD